MENGKYEIIFVALIQSTSDSYDVWMYISQQLDIICVKVFQFPVCVCKADSSGDYSVSGPALQSASQEAARGQP